MKSSINQPQDIDILTDRSFNWSVILKCSQAMQCCSIIDAGCGGVLHTEMRGHSP